MELQQVDDAHQGHPGILALVGGRVVGILSWHGQTIGLVWVAKAQRRQGIATRMAEAAAQTVPGLAHSGDRTRHADAWSATTGLPRPVGNPRWSRPTVAEIDAEGRAAARSAQARLTRT